MLLVLYMILSIDIIMNWILYIFFLQINVLIISQVIRRSA